MAATQFDKQKGVFWESPVTPDNLVIFNLLGQTDPADNAASLIHSAYNRAEPVFTTPAGRSPANRRVVGTPTLYTDAIDFSPGQALVSGQSDTLEMCEYILCASAASGLGSGSNDRGVASGSYENNASKGQILYANTGTVWRTFSFDGSGAIKTADLTVPDSVAKWRWLYRHIKATGGGNYEVKIQNLTGDSVNNTPTPTAMVGHTLGVHKKAVGYPYSQYTKSARVSMRAGFNVPHDDSQKAAVIAALRLIAANRTIDELATAA